MKIHRREEGQGLVEYALVLVLIAVVIILILTLLGESAVFVYARAVGGLGGQSLSGTGAEFMVLNADTAINQTSPSSCTVDISNMSIFMTSDGNPATDSSGTVTVTAPGRTTSVDITTNNVGMATGVSISLGTVGCPGKLVIGNTGFSVPIP